MLVTPDGPTVPAKLAVDDVTRVARPVTTASACGPTLTGVRSVGPPGVPGAPGAPDVP